MILLLFSFKLPTSFMSGWFTTFTVYLPSPMRFSASLQVTLIDSFSVSSCDFGVPMGGGELRVFLLCHLGPIPDRNFEKQSLN